MDLVLSLFMFCFRSHSLSCYLSVYLLSYILFVTQIEEWVWFKSCSLIEPELHVRLMPSYQNYKLSIIKGGMTSKQF